MADETMSKLDKISSKLDEVSSKLNGAADDKSDPGSIKKSDFLLHEYDALRNEVVQRITMRYQIITIALAAFGAVFAFANTSASVYLEMLYPLLSLFLLLTYISNAYGIRKASEFIKGSIENNVSEDGGTSSTSGSSVSQIGWQTYKQNPSQEKIGDLGAGTGKVVFPISSLIVWGVALSTIIAPSFQPITHYILNISVTYIALVLSTVIVVISFIAALIERYILNN